jgi:hypothetical protein
MFSNKFNVFFSLIYKFYKMLIDNIRLANFYE